MKIVHIVPHFFNYREAVLVETWFPDAIKMSTGPLAISELCDKEYEIKTEKLYYDLFDVVIQTSGGPVPTNQLGASPIVQEIFKKCHDNGGIVATICLGANTLAYALDLHGVTITCFPLKVLVRKLRSKGAIVTSNAVESYNRIVTAQTQIDTSNWIREIQGLIALKGPKKSKRV
jgi:putative intracellular protease/amidase